MEKKDTDMSALHELENVCCGTVSKDGAAALFRRFEAAPDGFAFSAFCDEDNKQWILQDNENPDKQYVSPFGNEVAYMLNLAIGTNPDCSFHGELDLWGFDEEKLKEYYEKNKKTLDYMKFFISIAEKMKLRDCFDVWMFYRHFAVRNDLWNLANKYAGSSIYKYALNILSNYVHKNMKHDKTLCTFGDKSYIADVYFMNDLSYLFEYDLFKILVDKKCGVFHECQRCGKIYFDNDKKTKYCFDCRKDKNTLIYEKRKSNVARFTHKKVADKIRQKGCDTAPFLAESNYYWSICQGKKPKTRKLKSYLNITSEKEYIEWLESKLHE